MNKKNAKKYWEMTAAELAEATRKFDEPFVASKGRRMNAAEKEKDQRYRMKLGRPRQGKGAKAVSVTIEQGLLSRTDAHAKRLGLSRAQFIAQSLETALRRKTG